MGVFAIRRDGVRQRLQVTGNTKRLLMLLSARANDGLRREHVIDEIWPDSTAERGNSALNTALSRLRTALGGCPGFAFEVIDDVVRFRVTPPAQSDAAALEAAVAAGPNSVTDVQLSAEQRWSLAAATEDCHGEFLEGCDDHWVLPLRERYSALFIQALTLLMHDARLGRDHERALDLGRRILAIDPFRESVQRAVMHLYCLNGQRAQAIRQYRSLEAQLRSEFDIAPMTETTAQFDRILDRRGQHESVSAGLHTP
jgi:DNA-binding SARP family transcriptional activator